MELSDTNVDFFISSSWDLESENKNLKSCVTFNFSNKRVALEDVVQLDTCLHLIQNKESTTEGPCTVKISLPESAAKQISQVVVVSEARIIELFGGCDEYITTCSADYVDDFEDCAVYKATCNIKPSTELLISFQKTKHITSLWLYGINLRLSQDKHPSPLLSSINFQSVNEILKEAKIPLSENAEKCKAFLQAYGGGALDSTQMLFKNKAPSPQILMKMMEAGYFNPIGDAGRNVSKCISNFVPFLGKDGAAENKNPDLSIHNDKGTPSDMVVLEDYLNQRFTELENRIDRFEQKMMELETRQNEKLDCIIALLNRPTS